MKLDKIIMNPPYSGNLHLKILSHLINEYPEAEVVNLSPIRWLQDPLAEYKKNTDWFRFEGIRAHISSLEVVPAKKANNLFGIEMTDLGIYHLTKEGGFDCKILWDHNSILEKVLAHKDNIYAHMTKGFTPGKWHIKVAEVRGTGSGNNFDIVSKRHRRPYQTAEEYMANKLAKSDAFRNDPNNERFVAFDTEEEGINFAEYTYTKFFIYLNKHWKLGVNVPLKFLPFMPTYTHPWNDEMLYEYFDLTEEEIREIEKCI